MKTKVKVAGNKIKLISGEGYSQTDRVLLKVTETGNGLICKFPSWSSIEQDYYVCLNYAQASYLKKALQHVENLGDDDE